MVYLHDTTIYCAIRLFTVPVSLLCSLRKLSRERCSHSGLVFCRKNIFFFFFVYIMYFVHVSTLGLLKKCFNVLSFPPGV